PPVLAVVIGDSLQGGQLSMMRLQFFGARGWMGQVQHNTCAPNGSANRAHLRGTAHVAADAVPHHLFVITADAVPKLFGGENEFASAQLVIRNGPQVTKSARDPDRGLSSFSPGNVDALGGPGNVGREILSQN